MLLLLLAGTSFDQVVARGHLLLLLLLRGVRRVITLFHLGGSGVAGVAMAEAAVVARVGHLLLLLLG
jgi:hypothetical protein